MRLTLAASEVHVWRRRLEQPADWLAELQATLDPAELERARRYHFDNHRREYISARGQLRLILGRYLELPPGQITFSYTPYGKPELSGLLRDALSFNLSHSGGWMVLAVTRRRLVGVDLEYIRYNFDHLQLARTTFSPAEQAALQDLPPALRASGFFLCWTRKESYIKAIGHGLSHPLDSFDVSLTPGQPAALLATRPDPAEARRWSIYDLDLEPGYAGALVVEGQDMHIVYEEVEWRR